MQVSEKKKQMENFLQNKNFNNKSTKSSTALNKQKNKVADQKARMNGIKDSKPMTQSPNSAIEMAGREPPRRKMSKGKLPTYKEVSESQLHTQD